MNNIKLFIASISILILGAVTIATGSVSDEVTRFKQNNPKAWQAVIAYKKAIQSNNSLMIQLLIQCPAKCQQIAYLKTSLIVAQHKFYSRINKSLLRDLSGKIDLPENFNENFFELIEEKNFEKNLRVAHGANCAMVFDKDTGAYIALTRVKGKWYIDIDIEPCAFLNEEIYSSCIFESVLAYRKATKDLAGSDTKQQKVIARLTKKIDSIWEKYDALMPSDDEEN